VLEFFQQLDAGFIDSVKTRNKKTMADQAEEKSKRDEKWKKLEEMAKANGMK